ncbi:TlpA family protein disulfide reductase [Usitatibacter palustris]|uniref:Thiol-disulfide oxidoreductase ResA n=1 Tax=Usitatibacter palustris TaxID=2732487 RepID=A0A6M4HEF0_9PROT|nr:TlpA disulfide reductase family protein [Usitatibacter palustris]QJR16903.1 Thiol-disulfide oxidoreductase ResA [Usitatibacter palustris]
MLAFLAGAALWIGSRAPSSAAVNPLADATPAALFAATFKGPEGQDQAIGQFQGKILVVNFWATWCAPCKEEMPGFVRLQARWKDKGVQFLGIANDDPAKVRRFGTDLAINYPLWTGGAEVSELSKRLGNRVGVLPHTVILDGQGRVLESRIGIYSEPAMEERLFAATKTAG